MLPPLKRIDRMNTYKVVYETDVAKHFTVRESWRVEANTKDEAKERVLAVHTKSKVLTIRKMPTKLGLVT